MVGMFSQLELAMIGARVRSGIANARAKGRKIGRPQVLEPVACRVYKLYFAQCLFFLLPRLTLVSICFRYDNCKFQQRVINIFVK